MTFVELNNNLDWRVAFAIDDAFAHEQVVVVVAADVVSFIDTYARDRAAPFALDKIDERVRIVSRVSHSTK